MTVEIFVVSNDGRESLIEFNPDDDLVKVVRVITYTR